MSLTTPSEASSPAPSATERVTVARTVAEVEALRPVWERLPIGNIDADIDHFLAVVAHRREVLRPHVVLIERPGQTDLLAVARLEELPLEARVGYRVVAAPRVRCIIGAFDGVVGADTEEDCRRILDELRRPLRDGEADVVLLPKLDVEGSLYEVAKAAGPWLCRDHAPLVTDHWSVALGEDLEGFLAPRSGKTRRGARNQDKRLQKTYGEALRIRRFESEDELDELCADLETIAAKTYQRQIGAGFTGDEFELALMRDRMRHGWFRAWVLYIADKPVAFWIGTAYADTFGTDCPGFDPEYAHESVGTYTMLRMIEDLCADPDLTRLDYGHGEADYKRRFGDTARQEADVLLFAATPRAMRINAVRTVAVKVTALARRLLGDSELGRKLKRSWRDRLAKQSQA